VLLFHSGCTVYRAICEVREGAWVREEIVIAATAVLRGGFFIDDRFWI
jgi:hypothetical protein